MPLEFGAKVRRIPVYPAADGYASEGPVAKLASNYDVDAILTLGDLQPSWLESLDKCCQPKLGVYGNHDDEPYMTYFGIDNLHLNQIDLDGGMTFAASPFMSVIASSKLPRR